MTLYYRTALVISSVFLNFSSFAATDAFPLPARLLGDGTAGTTAGTRGDLMLPLFGNERGIVYGDVQGKYYRDDSWFGGIAGGLRQTFGPYILGGYLFADRSESTSNKNFWSLNPGIEGMNAQWDGHVNGYFPVGSRSKTFRSAWADELGDYRYVNFSGHKQFDHILVDTETADRGVDAEVGYRVQPFNNLRLALGGYYFNFQNMNDLRGIIGTVEYPFNDRVTVLAQDAYDNLHNNTFMLTVRLRFGAINPQEGRMLEPIRRNLGTLDSGTSIPTERAWVDNGANLVEKDHIWFFKPGGETFDAAKGLANCTAEHPCTSAELTQSEINTISALDPVDSLYLATGTYLLDPAISERVALNENQSMEGRTLDFKEPAFGEERPTLIGGLDLSGNNSVSNIKLDNRLTDSAFSTAQKSLLPSLQTTQLTGMIVRNNNNMIRNISIGSEGNIRGYTLGIDIVNFNQAHNDLHIINSSILAQNIDSRTIMALRANTTNTRIFVDFSTIQARATNQQASFLGVNATGIELNGRTTLLMFNKSIVRASAIVNTGATIAPFINAQGLVLNDETHFNIISNSTFDVIGVTNLNAPISIRSIGINNNSSSRFVMALDQTVFNITSRALQGHASTWGIRLPSSAPRPRLTNVWFNLNTTGTSTSQVRVGP